MWGHVVTISHANGAWRELERHYNVVLPDALGHPMLGFRDGTWFAIGPGGMPQPLSARSAIMRFPGSAGSIVQVMCWWMREFHTHPRAIDLATELAFTVSEMASMAGLPHSSHQQLDSARRPEQPTNGHGGQQQYQQPYQQSYQQGYPSGQQPNAARAYPHEPTRTTYQSGYRADPLAGSRPASDPLTRRY
jgi:hypothetical protein